MLFFSVLPSRRKKTPLQFNVLISKQRPAHILRKDIGGTFHLHVAFHRFILFLALLFPIICSRRFYKTPAETVSSPVFFLCVFIVVPLMLILVFPILFCWSPCWCKAERQSLSKNMETHVDQRGKSESWISDWFKTRHTIKLSEDQWNHSIPPVEQRGHGNTAFRF